MFGERVEDKFNKKKKGRTTDKRLKWKNKIVIKYQK